MSVETMALYSDQQMGAVANQIKELVVTAMSEQELVTEAAAEKFLAQYAVIVIKKGWLGKTIDRVLDFKKPDDKKFQLVRIS